MQSVSSNSLTESHLNFSKIKSPTFAGKLNLVALMDIFTILVFFLLLNSGESDKLENAKFIKLPDSVAGTAPHVEAVIMIGEADLWLNNEHVLKLDELSDDKKNLSLLKDALEQHLLQKGELNAYEKVNGSAVTIMGDKAVSFEMLQAIMKICSEANFRDISLAVNRVASQFGVLPETNENSVSETLELTTVKGAGE